MKTLMNFTAVFLGILVLWFGSLAAQTADPTPAAAITVTPEAESTPTEEEAEKLNLNFATLEDVHLLPGVTEDIAQAILNGRPYQTLDDLLQIKGVTKEMLAEVQDFVEVQKLNLNDATLDELQMLPDMTQETAEAIIAVRPYKIIEELLKIRGFREDRLDNLREWIDAQPARPRRGTRGWNIRRSTGPLRLDTETTSKMPEATPTP